MMRGGQVGVTGGCGSGVRPAVVGHLHVDRLTSQETEEEFLGSGVISCVHRPIPPAEFVCTFWCSGRRESFSARLDGGKSFKERINDFLLRLRSVVTVSDDEQTDSVSGYQCEFAGELWDAAAVSNEPSPSA